MVAVHAGPPEFDQLGPDRLIRGKIKFLGAVITQFLSGPRTGLQPITADDLLAIDLFNQEMIADQVKRVLVKARSVRSRQALLQFEIKDLETQGLRSAHILDAHR